MPQYLVERTLPDGLPVAVGADYRVAVDHGVIWIHSYMSEDERKTFCVCLAPTPEAIRRAAALDERQVDRITRVRVLDPYFDK